MNGHPGDPGMMPPGMDPSMMGGMPPGFWGMQPAAFGLGGANYSQMGLAQQQAGAMLGGSVVGAAGSLGQGAMSALQMGAWTAAPLMAAGGASALTRGLGQAWMATDPFQWVFRMGGMGWRAGAAIGGRGLARVGLGALGATGVGLPIAAAGMAAMEIPTQMASRAFEGMQNVAVGQATLSQIAPTAFPGVRPTPGQGASFGLEMGAQGRNLDIGTEEVAGLVRGMDQMKLFQATRNVQEFRSRFKEVLSAVKEISQVTQTTLDDALRTFGDLRQQGFYTTADITAQAAKQKARSMATGLTEGQLTQAGMMGAQIARGMGMRGRAGAEFMQQQVGGMTTAFRYMTPEMQEQVMEMGGPEEVGARVGAQQMNFLRTARGRALIAATMGAGGAPDPARMSQLLQGGMTTESIVEQAAGRGVGVLRAAGSAQAREQFLPYAGMMMTMMAASQQQQLYGGVTPQGIVGMLGTMGMGEAESRAMLQQTMMAPQIMEREAAMQREMQARAEWDRRRRETSFMARTGRGFERAFRPFEEMGAEMGTSVQATYGQFMGWLGFGGPTENVVSGGTVDIARRFAAGGGRIERNLGLADPGGPVFGRTDRELFAQSAAEFVGEASELRRGRSGGLRAAAQDILTPRQRRAGVIELGGGLGIRSGDVTRAQGILQQVGSGERRMTQESEGLLSYGFEMGGMPGFFEQMEAQRQAAGWGMRMEAGEAATFVMAQRAGFLGMGRGGMEQDIKRWQQMSPEERLRLRAHMQRSMGARLPGGEREAADVFGIEMRALGPVTAEGARQRTEEAFSSFLGETMGRGMWGKTAALRDALTRDVESGQEFSDLVGTFISARGKPETQVRLEREAHLRKLREKFGENSPEYKEARSVLKQLEGQPAVLAEQRAKELIEGQRINQVLGTKAQLDAITSRMGTERTAMKSFMERKGLAEAMELDKPTQAAMQNLRAVVERPEIDPEARRAAYQRLFVSMAGGKGGFTEAEERALVEFTGDTKALSLVQEIRGFAGMDAKRQTEELIRLGVDEKRAKEISEKITGAKGEQGRVQAAVQAFGEMGLLDPALAKGGARETTLQGVQTTYVQANKAFVTAVSRFVHAMAKQFPELGELSAALDESVAGMSGGNDLGESPSG